MESINVSRFYFALCICFVSGIARGKEIPAELTFDAEENSVINVEYSLNKVYITFKYCVDRFGSTHNNNYYYYYNI